MSSVFEIFNVIIVQVPWFGLSVFMCTCTRASFINWPLGCCVSMQIKYGID
jgi:hypothetical protein